MCYQLCSGTRVNVLTRSDSASKWQSPLSALPVCEPLGNNSKEQTWSKDHKSQWKNIPRLLQNLNIDNKKSKLCISPDLAPKACKFLFPDLITTMLHRWVLCLFYTNFTFLVYYQLLRHKGIWFLNNTLHECLQNEVCFQRQGKGEGNKLYN